MALQNNSDEVVIACDHHSEWPAGTRKVEVLVWYEEWERTIKCCDKEDESWYVKRDKRSFSLGKFNPVDCEECKAWLLDFLESFVFHPNPNDVLHDIYKKVSGLRFKVAMAHDVEICGTSYEIINHIERHCMSHDKEWLITWVDFREQPHEQHPSLRAVEMANKAGNLPKKLDEFTCAICLEGVTNKGKKRKRSSYDNKEVARQEEQDCVDAKVCDMSTRVIRLLSCHHMFHKSCMDRWVKDGRRYTCPLCRVQLLKRSRCCSQWGLAKNRALDHSKAIKVDIDQLYM